MTEGRQRITAFVGLGSNIGDGPATLQKAWRAICETAEVEGEELSSPYRSAPVGMASDSWFLNAVGRLKTGLSPFSLLELLLGIEYSFGRRRDPDAQGYQDRTLDLDLLYYGAQVLSDERLILPHPLLAERLFVLKPLVEIAGDFQDPRDLKSPAQMLSFLRQRIREGEVEFQEICRDRWENDAGRNGETRKI